MNLYNLYLLYGEEPYLIEQYKNEILSALLTPDEREMNLTVFAEDPAVEELAGVSGMIPFWGGRNVILLQNTHLFSAAKGKKDETKAPQREAALLKLMEKIPEQTTIIFVVDGKVDKRRKTYKHILSAGKVKEAAPLKGAELSSWLKQRFHDFDKTVDAAALQQILAAVSLMSHASLTFLNQEIIKMTLYIGERTHITVDDVTHLLASVPEMSIFAMTDAISRRDIGQALTVLEEQLESGQPKLKILGLLAHHVRQLYQVKALSSEGAGSREIAAELKLPPFVADKVIKQSRAFRLAQLENAMGLIKQADEDLKLSREVSSLERILLFLCEPSGKTTK